MAVPAVVGDLREHWAPASAEELERFETGVLSGFVLSRASAGPADGTIRGGVGHLDQNRSWFGRPLWDMEPTDADVHFGKVLRHKVEIHRMTGRVVECQIDEMNRPPPADASARGRRRHDRHSGNRSLEDGGHGHRGDSGSRDGRLARTGLSQGGLSPSGLGGGPRERT